MLRREVLVSLGRAILLGMGYTATGRAALADEMAKLRQLPLPVLDDPGRPSFEVFHRLSQWVVGREDLDPETSRTLYAVFLTEPWGTKHISTAFAEISDRLKEEGPMISVADLVRAGHLGKGETWFVTHLLETWYLGVYFHETGDSRVLYQDALMYQTIARTHPVPGFSTHEYGFWAEAPIGLDRKPE